MSANKKQPVGYTTREALIKLRDEIQGVLDEHKSKNPIWHNFFKDIISFSSEKVLLSGVAYTITIIFIISLILIYFLSEPEQSGSYLLWEALILFVLLLVNFGVACSEQYLYRNEIPHRVNKVLDALDEAIDTVVWREGHYPHLYAPISPCVVLQWTYRDGELVNLPWALLVAGDVIVLRPGQAAPGQCRGPGDCTLRAGRRYQPPQEEGGSGPRLRPPAADMAFRLQETPYLANLRLFLDRAPRRPTTVCEKARYLCTVKIMEGIVLPVVITLVVAASCARHLGGVPGGGGAGGGVGGAGGYLLAVIAASLPLVQLVFPIAWVVLNCYGLARLHLVCAGGQRAARKSCSVSEASASEPLVQALSEASERALRPRALAAACLALLTGRADAVARTASLLHTLGSLSALCCVDKKGILSWPNPTAEKVFFLRNSSPESAASSQSTLGDAPPGGRGHAKGDAVPEPTTIAEVLDLTHEPHSARAVQFDEPRWRRHLAQLKPLGLAALLNTCAAGPAPALHARLCAHLSAAALRSSELVPVTNRRCLCALAEEIGFSAPAAAAYKLEHCLAAYRHLQADGIRRETRFARSLQLSARVKVPLPHMLSALVRDRAAQLHMLTQGTADIVLDSCTEYWNGRDLTPLSPHDRKRVLDFYQRNSLTAYCTAFAYKPVSRGVSEAVAQQYLELPASARGPPAPPPAWPPPLFHSSDSLLFNEVTEDDVTDAEGFFELVSNQVLIGLVTMQYQAQSDLVELIERLERACVRFVHFSMENELRSRVFSEKLGLESGWNCHISLASDDDQSAEGSPLSDGSRARSAPAAPAPAADARHHFASNMAASKALSLSAPGAIHLDHATVKFDDEIKQARHSITTHNGLKYQRASIPTTHPSADSLLEGGEGEGEGGAGAESPVDACRSLSCLTDSTDRSAPLHFDMSNRAKLPRGIENIRPHIEQVDNVPLLVSLFTDCSPRSVRLMLAIMQEHAEVVCVLGSAANCANAPVFMQADASIAVEPLYPVLCQKMPAYRVPDRCVGPIDLARKLSSVPCALSMAREADVSLFTLIMMSRHFTSCLWNAAQFWMCAAVFVALLQVWSLAALLPLALSAGGALWAGGVAVPALAAALAFAPPDAAAMTRAAPRPMHYSNQTAVFVAWCYVCKFAPALVATLAVYAAALRALCSQAAAAATADCWLVYPPAAAAGLGGNSTAQWAGWEGPLAADHYLAQHVALAALTLHLIVISQSFVHRHHSVWRRGFWTNRVWCCHALLLVVAQTAYSAAAVGREGAGRVGAGVWAAAGGAPLLAAAVAELVKWHEIKADARYQRRARLDFGTKLGMNSPF